MTRPAPPSASRSGPSGASRAGIAGLAAANARPACCQASAAAAADAVFCGECGSLLLRCAAYEECGGLVDASGFCPACFNLELYLNSGAARRANLGAAMTLPLIVVNAGAHGRALFITELWIRQGSGERKRQELPWERLDAGQGSPWPLQTQPLQQSGRQSFEVILVAASRSRWREEMFAVAANLEIGVENDGQIVVNQTINVAGGETAGAGHVVYAPIKIEGDDRGRSDPDAATAAPSPLALTRADGFERARGLRGDPQVGRVDRTVRLAWKGFANDEAGPPGPILTPDGLLALGRSRIKSRGGANDARLVVRDAAGALDAALSEEISRRHFDLFVQNGALCVRAAGQSGLRVGDQGLRQGEVAALSDGERIVVLPKHPQALAIDVLFETHHGVVEQVTLTRVPDVQRAFLNTPAAEGNDDVSSLFSRGAGRCALLSRMRQAHGRGGRSHAQSFADHGGACADDRRPADNRWQAHQGLEHVCRAGAGRRRAVQRPL